jgi:hypothetical protein
MSDETDSLILRFLKEKKTVSLQSLVDMLVRDHGLKTIEATKRIHNLGKRNKIDILETGSPSAFSSYALGSGSLWFWILNITVLVSVAVCLLPLNSFLYLRYILGSIYVLYLPGAVLVEALYPRQEDLDAITRITLSIVSSLALVTTIAFLLNYTPFKITLIPLTISTAILTLALAIFAFVRKYRSRATYLLMAKDGQ